MWEEPGETLLDSRVTPDCTTVTIVIEIGKMMKRGIAPVQSPVFHPEIVLLIFLIG